MYFSIPFLSCLKSGASFSHMGFLVTSDSGLLSFPPILSTGYSEPVACAACGHPLPRTQKGRDRCKALQLLSWNPFFFFFFFFFGPYLQHMEVSRLEVKLEPQPQAYTAATAMPDPSHVCNLPCSSHHNARSLTNQGLNPHPHEYRLVLYHWAATETSMSWNS